jgi:hypothetical protein
MSVPIWQSERVNREIIHSSGDEGRGSRAGHAADSLGFHGESCSRGFALDTRPSSLDLQSCSRLFQAVQPGTVGRTSNPERRRGIAREDVMSRRTGYTRETRNPKLKTRNKWPSRARSCWIVDGGYPTRNPKPETRNLLRSVDFVL